MRGQSERLVTLGFVEHGEAAITCECCKFFADVAGIRFVVEAVVQPDDAGAFTVRGLECGFERRDSARPIGLEGLRQKC